MLDVPESGGPASLDVLRLDDHTDDELDALSFGVVGLAPDGTILRYNLYESRFARLDRNQVLGRNFFTEVARCTRTEAFEGRFRAFASGASSAVRERFDYLFDFAFGAQEVSVEIVRVPGAARIYLLINRKQVHDPRPEFPKELLAAAQRDLAPDERARGVRRDVLERRFVDAPATLLGALRATCDRLAPDTWEIFATEWGVQWGRRIAVDLEASALENGLGSVREVSMRDLAEQVSAYFADRGWGSASFEFDATLDGIIALSLDRSALAEAAPRASSTAHPRAGLACHLFAGAVAGVLSSVAGRRLVGREVACVASGAQVCVTVIAARERREALDAALAAGATDLSALREALRRGRRAGAGR